MRALALIVLTLLATVFIVLGCTSLPKVKHRKHKFPANRAFYGKPARPFKKLGLVRSKVNFPTLDPDSNEDALCHNYFNSAVHKLIGYAEKQGADAVMQVNSVVFFLDGTSKRYSRAECSDDGGEGQVLAQGIAIKWVKK